MMKRPEALALVATALALCAILAWAVHAVLRPDSVLAIGAMFSLC